MSAANRVELLNNKFRIGGGALGINWIKAGDSSKISANSIECSGEEFCNGLTVVDSEALEVDSNQVSVYATNNDDADCPREDDSYALLLTPSKISGRGPYFRNNSFEIGTRLRTCFTRAVYFHNRDSLSIPTRRPLHRLS